VAHSFLQKGFQEKNSLSINNGDIAKINNIYHTLFLFKKVFLKELETICNNYKLFFA